MGGEVNVGTLEAVLTLRDELTNPASKISQALKQLSGSTDDSSAALGRHEKALTTSGVAMANWIANYLTKATDAVIGFVKGSVDAAAELESITKVAEYMGAKWGLTAEQVHALTAALNHQGISMRQANDTVIQFIRSELDLSKATQLATIAQSAARIAGINSSETLNRMIYGIQSLQPEVLRTVGITVSVDQATREYASSIGKSVSALSQGERQQALMNAVLKEGEKISGVYAKTNETVAGRELSLVRLRQDAAAIIGQSLLPAYRVLIDVQTALFKSIASAPEQFRDLAFAIAGVGIALNASWAVPAGLALVALDLLMGAFTGTLDPIENFKALLKAIPVLVDGFRLWILNIAIVMSTLAEKFVAIGIGAMHMEAALVRVGAKMMFGDAKKQALEYADSLDRNAFAAENTAASMKQFTDKLWEQRDAVISGTSAAKESNAALKDAEARAKAAYEALQKKKDAEARAAEEAKRHAEAVKKLVEQYSGMDLARKVTDLNAAYAQLGAGGVLNLDKLREEAAKLEAEGAKLSPRLHTLAQEFRDNAAAAKEADEAWAYAGKITSIMNEMLGNTVTQEALNDIQTALMDIGGASYIAADQVEGFAQKLIVAKNNGKELTPEQEAVIARWEGMRKAAYDAAEAEDAWNDAGKKTIGIGKLLGDALAKLPGVILGALQGGGDVFKSIGSSLGGDLIGGMFGKDSKATKFLTDTLGKTFGGALAGLAGPLGSIAGSLIGGLFDKLNLFGNKLEMQANDIRDEYLKAHGGFEQLGKDLTNMSKNGDMAAATIKRLFDAKNPEAFKKAQEQVDKAMEAFSNLLQKVGAKDMRELELKAKQAGISLQKVFDAKTVEDYQRAVEGVSRQFDLWTEANDKLNAAMERYGITVDQLGPKMRQQKLDEQAMQLFQDWELLRQAGVDINLLIEKMGPGMMEYVNRAVQAGATIPEAMRPVIDKLWEQGKLLHEDGSAYTEAEYLALKYGKSQQEMFDALIEKITQLINALLGIPPEVNTRVNVHTTHTEDPENPPEDPDNPNKRHYAGGSRGFRDFGTGTPAVLHGVERVQTRAQYEAETAGAAEISEASMRRLEYSLGKVFRDAVVKAA